MHLSQTRIAAPLLPSFYTLNFVMFQCQQGNDGKVGWAEFNDFYRHLKWKIYFLDQYLTMTKMQSYPEGRRLEIGPITTVRYLISLTNT